MVYSYIYRNMYNKRRIQSTGGSSYFVTLPKDWIIRNDIDKKSEVDIFQVNSGALLINKSSSKKPKEIELVVDDIGSRKLKRIIIGYYASGVDIIMLKTKQFFSPEIRVEIRKLSSLLVGFEVFEEEPNCIIVKRTAENNTSAEAYVNKIVNFIVSMYKDFLKTVEKYDAGLLKDIILRDDEIDRINLFLSRKLITTLGNLGIENEITTTLVDISMYEHVSIRLERISDYIEELARVLLQIGPKSAKYLEPELRLINEVEWFLTQAQKMIITKDKAEVHKLLDRFEEGFKYAYKDFEGSMSSPENVIIHYALYRIVSYSANIGEYILNSSSLK